MGLYELIFVSLFSLVLCSSWPDDDDGGSLGFEIEDFPLSEVLSGRKDDDRRDTRHNVEVRMMGKLKEEMMEKKKEERIKGRGKEIRKGRLELKVDDKHGLVKEGPYNKMRKNSSLPRICDNDDEDEDEDGVKCKKISSKVYPPTSEKATRDLEKFPLYERRKRKAENSECEHEVDIEAFGSKHSLCLFLKDFKDESILSKSWSGLNITVFGSGNDTRDVRADDLGPLKYAVGFVKEQQFTSVSGFLMDDHFYGTVYMRDAVHYLEPHDRKSRDMHIFGDGLKTLLHKHDVKDPEKVKDKLPANQRTAKGIPQRRICDLTLVSDHLFFDEIGEGDLRKTVLQMLWHVKEANALFQSKDFDDDGESECLGFTVSEITVFKSADSELNLLTGDYSVPEDFLKRFSRYNFDGFCLGVLFTNRAFSELVLGLSWRGNPKPDGVGGICQSRVRIKSDKFAYSFNALFISLKSSQEERIPLRMGVLNLVHELMHSFGGKHDPDPENNPECTPKDKWINGRFLMSKFSNDGHKLNHEILSPCTKDLVKVNLRSPTRVNCLIEAEESFCGDGIVQAGEECDCGTVFQCIAARSCCVPPEGGNPDRRPCTVQTDLNPCVH